MGEEKSNPEAESTEKAPISGEREIGNGQEDTGKIAESATDIRKQVHYTSSNTVKAAKFNKDIEKDISSLHQKLVELVKTLTTTFITRVPPHKLKMTTFSVLKELIKNLSAAHDSLESVKEIVMKKDVASIEDAQAEVIFLLDGIKESDAEIDELMEEIDAVKRDDIKSFLDMLNPVLENLKNNYSIDLVKKTKQLTDIISTSEVSPEEIFKEAEPPEEPAKAEPPILEEPAKVEPPILEEPAKVEPPIPEEPAIVERPTPEEPVKAEPLKKLPTPEKPAINTRRNALLAKEKGKQLKKLSILTINKELESLKISEHERQQQYVNRIKKLPENLIDDGDKAYRKRDYVEALKQYDNYIYKLTKLINDIDKERLKDSYEDLYEQTRNRAYYASGKEFDQDAVKNPSLNSVDCKHIDATLAQVFRPDIREKVALGILRTMELHKLQEERGEELDQFEPSPFMQTIHEELTGKLFRHYDKKGEINPSYVSKPGNNINDNNLHFFSTLNTELDDIGIDFFYKIDGEVFADGLARIIPVDITLDTLKSKREKKGERAKYSAVLSMGQLEKTPLFREGEPKFLVATCNSDNTDPLKQKNNRDRLEYDLCMLSMASKKVNDRIVKLAEYGADQIILELDNQNDIQALEKELEELKEKDAPSIKIKKLENKIEELKNPSNRLDLRIDELEQMAERTGLYAPQQVENHGTE